jgi:SAM-dependent methyltransferase
MSSRLAQRAWISVKLRLADGADRAGGRRDPLVPPRRANFVGNSDFAATGDQFLGLFRTYGNLRSSDRVLDVGCGIGRMARPLTRVLAPPTGSYDGFDVVAPAIAWCQRHYRATPVPFRFVHADVHNPEYNPTGSEAAGRFRFPYPDHRFDLVIATSVFTHLLAADARHYLSEIARVLAPGGRLFSTWFVLDDDLAANPTEPMINFAHQAGEAIIAHPTAPAAAVGYRRDWLQSAVDAGPLELCSIVRGSWTGEPGPTPQDLVLAQAPTPGGAAGRRQTPGKR